MHGLVDGVKPMQLPPVVVQKGIGPVVLVVLETVVVVIDTMVVVDTVVLVDTVVVEELGRTSLNAGTQYSRTAPATSTAGPKFVLFTDTVRAVNRFRFGGFAW